MEFKRLGLAGFTLVSALSLAGCVESVTDYYEDYDYPAPPVVVVRDRPVVVGRPVVVDRPIVVRQRPVVVREHEVFVHERPAYRDHEVVVRRPSHHNRYRYEESAFVRPHARPGQSTVVRHRDHQEDDSIAEVHPRSHSRNDREESVVVRRWDKTRNVAPPSTVSERPYNNNGSTTVIERQ